jgi:hypothetical protein
MNAQLTLNYSSPSKQMDQAGFKALEVAETWIETTLPCGDLRAQYKVKGGAKWRLASGLQKAIRRGYVEETGHLAAAFFDLDKQYFIYRMATIACEDVGMGNFAGITAFSAIADCQKLRKGRERELYVRVARDWAAKPKDRNATEVSCLNDLGTPEQKAKVDRYASAMTLYGQGLAHLQYGRDNLAKFWLGKGMDPVVVYVTDLLLRRQRTMIPLGLAPVVGIIGNQLPEWEADVYPWECHRIGRLLPAATFDKHTREGKRAIATLCNKKGIDNKPGTGMVVFTAEGCRVDKRLVYPGSKMLVKEAKIAIDRIPAESNLSVNEAEAILATLVENAELLQELRVWAYSAK